MVTVTPKDAEIYLAKSSKSNLLQCLTKLSEIIPKRYNGKYSYIYDREIYKYLSYNKEQSNEVLTTIESWGWEIIRKRFAFDGRKYYLYPKNRPREKSTFNTAKILAYIGIISIIICQNLNNIKFLIKKLLSLF